MCILVASIFNRRCINEGFGTVDGVELPFTPECHGTSSGKDSDSSVLVADVSSNFLRYATTIFFRRCVLTLICLAATSTSANMQSSLAEL